jgi:sterol desaturase/sphingolipid hydroxylase (fatty acid hydroxylase superfamily)
MSMDEIASIRFGVFIGGLVFLLLFELIIPYRPSTIPKLKRWFINLGITIFNSLILKLLFASALIQTSLYVTDKQLGVLNMTAIPSWAKVLVTVIFMDFMLYVWHLLNHEMPLLWRFHRVHHTDLYMDVSTATRFHIGELAISAVIKISLVFFLGADLIGVVLFETLLVLSAQFHHSSLTVPTWFEKLFWVLFVPPSMHRIHHAVVIKQRDSNYGTIFSIWDRILGTLITDVDQDRIRIGVGGHYKPAKLNFYHLLVMPFTAPVK